MIYNKINSNFEQLIVKRISEREKYLGLMLLEKPFCDLSVEKTLK